MIIQLWLSSPEYTVRTVLVVINSMDVIKAYQKLWAIQ
jgi:hypothetical protein